MRKACVSLLAGRSFKIFGLLALLALGSSGASFAGEGRYDVASLFDPLHWDTNTHSLHRPSDSLRAQNGPQCSGSSGPVQCTYGQHCCYGNMQAWCCLNSARCGQLVNQCLN